MKNAILFFLFVFFIPIFAKQQIGCVTFSWNKAGDVKLVAQYKSEELHPVVGWHINGPPFKSKESKMQFSNVVHIGRLMVGECYCANQKQFSFWEYIKSFFWESEPAGCQVFRLFDDGSKKYDGQNGDAAMVFTRGSIILLTEWEKLRR